MPRVATGWVLMNGMFVGVMGGTSRPGLQSCMYPKLFPFPQAQSTVTQLSSSWCQSPEGRKHLCRAELALALDHSSQLSEREINLLFRPFRFWTFLLQHPYFTVTNIESFWTSLESKYSAIAGEGVNQDDGPWEDTCLLSRCGERQPGRGGGGASWLAWGTPSLSLSVSVLLLPHTRGAVRR